MGELGAALLACLRHCQLVDFRTRGRQSHYALTCPELIVLRSAGRLLAQTGDAVALCPIFGDPFDSDHDGHDIGRCVVMAAASADRQVVLRRRLRWLVAATKSPTHAVRATKEPH